jgi:ABC-2 type transport system permease protein
VSEERSQIVGQVLTLARRSVVRTLRQPIMIVPGVTFPLFLLAVNSAGLDAATRIPGFPTDSYLTFALALTFMQAGLFATSSAGTDLAEDIRTGFLNRLSLTPMRGAALIAGQLAGVLALALFDAVVFLAVGLAAGGHMEAGIGGVPVLFLLAAVIGLAFGTIGIFAALRTGDGEAVQGLFPLLFVLLFMSSMALPRDLIENDWFRTVADWNPFSYLIEGLRSLFITGWDGAALGKGFAVSAAIFLLGLLASARSLRTRLVRT